MTSSADANDADFSLYAGRFARSCIGALVGIALFAPQTARAYEDQVVLTLDVGFAAALANDELPQNGVAAGVGVNVGLNDAWALHARFGYAYHPNSDPLHVSIVGVEVVYLVDILEFVPYFGLGIDGIGTVRDGFDADLGFHAVVGIDWLAARKWLVGLEIRPYVLPFSIADNGVDPVYLTVDLRFGVVFDRF
ncbi:MAG: outer membrane beta-barrel protein [Myxococcota bacterium]